MDKLLLILGFVVSLLAAEATAQEAASDLCDVPVVVADFNNQTVRNLTPADFSVRLGGALSPVASAAIDVGSKRLALVLDASNKVPQEEWKLETDMAAELVKHARAKDRFALLVIG